MIAICLVTDRVVPAQAGVIPLSVLTMLLYSSGPRTGGGDPCTDAV